MADIVPHGPRPRWLSGDQLADQLVERSADPELNADLDSLAGRALENL